MIFLYFGCFSGGGGIWDSGGGESPPPQEIAGNNTVSDTISNIQILLYNIRVSIKCDCTIT